MSIDVSSSIKGMGTFKSQNSFRGILSSETVSEQGGHHEKRPMLPGESKETSQQSSSQEVIVKIDDEGDVRLSQKVRHFQHVSSLGIWRTDSNSSNGSEDPFSKLIGNFLNKQRDCGGEKLLDIDLDMEELRNWNYTDFPPSVGLPPSRELKVSFRNPKFRTGEMIDIGLDEKENSSRVGNRRKSVSIQDPGDNVSVLKCTSFQRRASGIGKVKAKSRLMDPPEMIDRRSGMIKSDQLRSGMLKSGQLRSGLLKSGILEKSEEDEDDPLFDEDLPDDYNRAQIDILTILECISLLVLVIALVCTLVVSSLKATKFRGLSLWKWEVLVFVLICGRLVSGWGIRISVFFIERNFFMRKRILYFVYGVRKSVRNCIWLGLVLVAWTSMFDKKVDRTNFLKFMNKFMFCLLLGTLLWLVKTLMVKVLASSFHVSTFFDRIQESVFNQYVIETLSGPPVIEIRSIQEEEEKTMAEVSRLQKAGATLPPELSSQALQYEKSRKAIGSGKGMKASSFNFSQQLQKGQDDHGIPINTLHKMNNKNVSAWNMKRLIKIVKHGALSTVDEQALNSSQDDESTTLINSECEAKAAARRIFRNVAKPRAKFIELEDLMRFLQEEEALKTLSIVEGSAESGKINKRSLKNWVVNAFRERKALALTLNDTKTAVNKLHQLVDVIMGIIIILISLVILGIATSKFLVFISSEIVVATFIFGNSCRTIFEAVIFVFVIHPFDVGDRCEVDGVQMIVEEMNILTTVFLKGDNQKVVFPNVTLATRPISNYYRSPDMGDSVDFMVHIATPAEKIGIMKQRITSYIENKTEHWYPSPAVVLMDLQGLNSLKLSVWLRHRMNHQDIGEKWKRRALLVEEMVNIFKELDIEYRLYPLDVHIAQLDSGRIPPPWIPPLAENLHR